MKCGEQYRLQRRTPAPERPAAWFAQGTAFHGAVEAYERSGRELAPEDTLDLADTLYRAEIARLQEREPALWMWLTGPPGGTEERTQRDIEKRAVAVRTQVNGYLEYVEEAREVPWEYGPSEYAVEVEVRLHLPSGVQVLMYVDQIIEWPNGDLSIRDLKTGTRKEVWPLQLAIAAHGVQQQFGVPVHFGDYWYAKDFNPSALYNLERFSLPLLDRWFARMDEAEKAGIFLPNPGDHCRVCPVADYCAATGGALADWHAE